jgi:hypothetical protein
MARESADDIEQQRDEVIQAIPPENKNSDGDWSRLTPRIVM